MPKDAKEIQRLVRAALEQGWTKTESGSGHIKLVSPEGQVQFLGKTPGGHRAYLNARADLRRKGLEV